MEQIEKQMRGYKGLSKQKYEEESRLISQRLAADIVKMPQMQRMQSQIALARQQGQDPAPLIDQARVYADQIAGYLVEAVKGQAGPKETSDAAMLISDKTMAIIAGIGGREVISKRKAVTEAEKAKLGWAELGLEEKKFKAKAGEEQDKYYKRIHTSKIAPLQSFMNKFVRVKGEKPEAVRLGEEILAHLRGPEVIKEAEEVFEGAITPQNILKLKQRIDQMDTKAMNQKLSDKDFAWLSRAYDLFAKQKEFEFEPAFETGVKPFVERDITTPAEPSALPAPSGPPSAGGMPSLMKRLPTRVITPEPAAPIPPVDNTEAKIQYLIQQLIQNNVPPADAERIAREQLSGVTSQ